jgi:hypothetical protein
MKQLIFILAIITAVSFSCYYDSEESLYPEGNLGNCDTTIVTYSGSIAIMLDNNCLSCHSAKTSVDKGGNINLQGYANVFGYKESISAAINHTGPAPMPKNTSKLKDCLIRQFDIWVAAGALEN